MLTNIDVFVEENSDSVEDSKEFFFNLINNYTRTVNDRTPMLQDDFIFYVDGLVGIMSAAHPELKFEYRFKEGTKRLNLYIQKRRNNWHVYSEN